MPPRGEGDPTQFIYGPQGASTLQCIAMVSFHVTNTHRLAAKTQNPTWPLARVASASWPKMPQSTWTKGQNRPPTPPMRPKTHVGTRAKKERRRKAREVRKEAKSRKATERQGRPLSQHTRLHIIPALLCPCPLRTLVSRVWCDAHVPPQLPNCGKTKQRGWGWAWDGCFSPCPQGVLAMAWYRRLF